MCSSMGLETYGMYYISYKWGDALRDRNTWLGARRKTGRRRSRSRRSRRSWRWQSRTDSAASALPSRGDKGRTRERAIAASPHGLLRFMWVLWNFLETFQMFNLLSNWNWEGGAMIFGKQKILWSLATSVEFVELCRLLGNVNGHCIRKYIKSGETLVEFGELCRVWRLVESYLKCKIEHVCKFLRWWEYFEEFGDFGDLLKMTI